VSFSRTPARYDKAPPALGADQDDVLSWLEQTPSRRARDVEPQQASA
jgi:hypothetical protein